MCVCVCMCMCVYVSQIREDPHAESHGRDRRKEKRMTLMKYLDRPKYSLFQIYKTTIRPNKQNYRGIRQKLTMGRQAQVKSGKGNKQHRQGKKQPNAQTMEYILTS